MIEIVKEGVNYVSKLVYWLFENNFLCLFMIGGLVELLNCWFDEDIVKWVEVLI